MPTLELQPILPVPAERCPDCGEAMVHRYRETPRGDVAEYASPICGATRLNTTEALLMLRGDPDAEVARLARAVGIDPSECGPSDLPMLRREHAEDVIGGLESKARFLRRLVSGECTTCAGWGRIVGGYSCPDCFGTGHVAPDTDPELAADLAATESRLRAMREEGAANGR